jgi:hypothetical protein
MPFKLRGLPGYIFKMQTWRLLWLQILAYVVYAIDDAFLWSKSVSADRALGFGYIIFSSPVVIYTGNRSKGHCIQGESVRLYSEDPVPIRDHQAS